MATNELVPVVTVLTDIMGERARQIDKGYTTTHDIQEGVDHLVQQADIRLIPGWSTRKDLVEAAALLVAAIMVMDTSDGSV